MTGDLVAWLREKIAQDRDLYEIAAKRPRSNKPILQSMLDKVEAYTAILDAYDESAKELDVCDQRLVGEHYAFDHAVRCVALAYRHRDGYRKEWRPQAL